MKRLLALSFLAFAILVGDIVANESVSDERISEISQRLESYDTDSLIERRDFLVSYQEAEGGAGGQAGVDSAGVPAGSASERAIEISIIEISRDLSEADPAGTPLLSATSSPSWYETRKSLLSIKESVL